MGIFNFDGLYGISPVLFYFIKAIYFVLIITGALECFAGYRLMRLMITVAGFFAGLILGALLGIRLESGILIPLLGVLFGILLAFGAFKLYMAGVFLYVFIMSFIVFYILFTASGTTGAGFAVVSAVLSAAAGALVLYFLRPVVIISTAAGGAWTIINAAFGLIGTDRQSYILILIMLWSIITAAGIFCQFYTTMDDGAEFFKRKPCAGGNELSFSERKYPGMQRAYRNYCIRCGCEMTGEDVKCPACGYKIRNLTD